jgi:hypothetical protein
MTLRFYPSTVPERVPDGWRLAHNHVRPRGRGRRQGWRGFRYWIQDTPEALVRCDCEWAPEDGEHYRVSAP